MVWMIFLRDYEHHRAGDTHDIGRQSHARALVAAGIANYTTEPADIDFAGGDPYVDVLFSEDIDGDVTGPTSEEISGGFILQSDNTWVDPSAVGHTGTTGSVFFAGAGGAGSAPTEDNTNFFWDDTSDYLGLGNNSPDARLDIAVDISADHGQEIRRTNATAANHTLFIGESVATVPDFAVFGDGRVVVNTGQATANAQLRVEMLNGGPALAAALYVDNNRDGALDTEQCATFNHEGLVGDAVDIIANSLTTAWALDVSANGLTTGGICDLHSSSASVASRELVRIRNTNSAATGTIPLVAEQVAANSVCQLRNGSGGTNAVFDIDENGNTWISRGASPPAAAAQLQVDQSSTTAALPVLLLDQADISEEMIQFETTIGTGNAIEAIGAKTLTTTHFIKVTLPGGLTRYIPCGTIA
jgi:hypothetical protein